MFRYKLIIEYDGTNYCGWQYQEVLPTVQGCIERAVEKLCGSRQYVQCSGRTDAGVHALGQLAHVDLPIKYDDHKVQGALNHYLKDEAIVIISAQLTTPEFHARHNSVERGYKYIIANRQAPLALEDNRVWQVPYKLNVEAMQNAAKLLLGTHDFTTFRDSECQANSPIKTLDEITITQEGDKIYFFTRAKSFLHHQVRNMVGSLIMVGRNKWTIEDFKMALDAKDRKRGGPTAPPYGLYFLYAKTKTQN